MAYHKASGLWLPSAPATHYSGLGPGIRPPSVPRSTPTPLGQSGIGSGLRPPSVPRSTPTPLHQAGIGSGIRHTPFSATRPLSMAPPAASRLTRRTPMAPPATPASAARRPRYFLPTPDTEQKAPVAPMMGIGGAGTRRDPITLSSTSGFRPALRNPPAAPAALTTPLKLPPVPVTPRTLTFDPPASTSASTLPTKPPNPAPNPRGRRPKRAPSSSPLSSPPCKKPRKIKPPRTPARKLPAKTALPPFTPAQEAWLLAHVSSAPVTATGRKNWLALTREFNDTFGKEGGERTARGLSMKYTHLKGAIPGVRGISARDRWKWRDGEMGGWLVEFVVGRWLGGVGGKGGATIGEMELAERTRKIDWAVVNEEFRKVWLVEVGEAGLFAKFVRLWEPPAEEEEGEEFEF